MGTFVAVMPRYVHWVAVASLVNHSTFWLSSRQINQIRFVAAPAMLVVMVVEVPAFLLTSVFQPLVAPSLGFAGGAMIFLVMSELLPESLQSCSRTDTAWGVTLGLVGMLGFTAILGL